MENDFKKMKEGKLYYPAGEEIMKQQRLKLELLYKYNKTRPLQIKKREKLIKKMFAKVGMGCYIEPPFHANWGGANVSLGKFFYSNFNLTLVDDTTITIGDYCMFAPNVTVATASHPINAKFREKGYQFNLPVKIGNNVWIGAGAVILPGVTVGDNTVIGAGSVVTKDLPSGVVAVGNPCRVLRQIGAHDSEFYYKDKKIDIDITKI